MFLGSPQDIAMIGSEDYDQLKKYAFWFVYMLGAFVIIVLPLITFFYLKRRR